MTNRRKVTRFKRRMKVRYGATELNQTGYTLDVSQTGLLISGNSHPPLHSQVHVQLFIEPGRGVYFESKVVRHVQVPPNLRQVVNGAFGVRFLSASELLTPALNDSRRFERSFASRDELRLAYQHELRLGAVTVQTDTILPPGTEVKLVIGLEFAATFAEFDAKVMYVMNSSAQWKGLGLMLDQPKALVEAMSPYLA